MKNWVFLSFVVLFQVISNSAFACVVLDQDGQLLNYMTGNLIFNANSKVINYIDNNTILDSSGAIVAYVNSTTVTDPTGEALGYATGNAVMDLTGDVLGYGSDCSANQLATVGSVLLLAQPQSYFQTN